MNNRSSFARLVGLLPALLFAGCGDLSTQVLTSVSPSIPTYSQDQEVTKITPFRLKIDRAYWTDSLGMAKPQARFLVVEFSVTNLSNQAIAWKPDAPPVFVLVNPQGATYSSAGQRAARDDLTATVILGQSNMNPGMPLRGRKVFDVPQGEYVMDVSFGVGAGGFSFAPGRTLFKWTLDKTVDGSGGK